MLRKNLIIIGAVVVLIAAVLIPPVRAAAETALSVFRVGDAHTIRISVTDLQEIAEYMEDHGAAFDPESEDGLSQMIADIESRVKPLEDISEFDAFPFTLPTALEAETPELYTIDARSDTVTLDTAEINAALMKLGGATLLSDSMNGASITVSTPPAVMAEYESVALIATQTVSVDAEDATLDALKNALLSIPAIPENVRAQLIPIDPKTNDIYLPVIEGLGRETALNGATGYVYTTGDLAQVLSMMPQTAGSDVTEELQSRTSSALIWTKNGVLYCLVGEKSDSALSQIARSVR